MALSPAETARLAQLKAALDGRTDQTGQARKGYVKNVAAVRAEIAKLEAKGKAVDKAAGPA